MPPDDQARTTHFGYREVDEIEKASLVGEVFTSVAAKYAANRKRVKWVLPVALAVIGLAEERDRIAGVLSHGQKQWLEIGMLLVQSPHLLLVDEPVAGMTHQEMDRTAELLTSLAGRHSVVVVEHDMDFVRSIAKRVTVLHQGSVLAEGTMDEVQNDPKVVEVYLGE